MPCDTWLRLDQYQDGQPIGKSAWLWQQLDTLVSANKHVMKSIQKTTLQNKLWNDGDELQIPIRNHILIRDHPEGHDKFQDWYKSDIYVIVDSHKEELNVYYIWPLDTTQKVKPKVVNWQELYNLKRSSPQSESQDSDTVDDQIPQIVQFIPDKTLRGNGRTFSPFTHPYNTRSKNKQPLFVGRQWWKFRLHIYELWYSNSILH